MRWENQISPVPGASFGQRIIFTASIQTCIFLLPMVSARAKRRLIDFIAQRATLIQRPEHPAKTRARIVNDFRFGSFALLVSTIGQGYLRGYPLVFIALTLAIWLISAIRTARLLRKWDCHNRS